MREKNAVLDQLDRKIILELQKNGRASSREIGEKLKVSDGTVRFRVNRLVKRGVLRITATINPFAFTNGMTAMVGMELEKRTHARTMEKISRLGGVLSVCNVSGKYDLMVETFFESREDMMKFLVEDLSGIEGINRTETFIILDAMNKWIHIPDSTDPARLQIKGEWPEQ